MFDTLTKIKNLLETNFGKGGVIKDYFIDDPNLIPVSSLPCIAISPVSTDINIADTGRDSFTFAIDVILIIDAKMELSKYKGEMVGTQFLAETMERKDSSGNLEANSILYVLRKNMDLGDNWYIQNISRVDYGLRVRSEQLITKEASCRIEVIRYNNRPT